MMTFEDAISSLTDKNGMRLLPVLLDMRQRDDAVLIVNLAGDGQQAQISAFVADERTDEACTGILSIAEAGSCSEVIVYCGETSPNKLIDSLKESVSAALTVLTGPSTLVLRDETALFSVMDTGIVRVNRAEQDYASSFLSYGYHGRPTLVVDAETAYQAGRLTNNPCSGVTKLVFIIGSEAAIMEAPAGTSIAELLKDHGYKGSALIGGSCGWFVKSEAFGEVCIGFSYEYDCVCLLSDGDCAVDVLNNLYLAAKEHSCGKCVMCREGSWQLSAIFTDMSNGRSNRDDIALIEDICPIIQASALCAFGRNMINPALSATTIFHEELYAHVITRCCKAGKCAGLMKYIIDPSLCTGCGKCIDACPVEAITKDGDKCVIDPEKCVDCGACVGQCPLEAIAEK